MSTRDQELDDIARRLQQGAPLIEKPDELTPDLGAMCFLDKHRLCGADCSAYVGDDEPTPAERCTLLSTASDGLVMLRELLERSRRARMTVAHPFSAPEPPDPFPPRGQR